MLEKGSHSQPCPNQLTQNFVHATPVPSTASLQHHQPDPSFNLQSIIRTHPSQSTQNFVHATPVPSTASLQHHPVNPVLINQPSFLDESFPESQTLNNIIRGNFPYENDSPLVYKYNKLIEKGVVTDLLAKEAILELVVAVDNNLLSYVQVEILLEKISGLTYTEIQNKFNIRTRVTVERILKRTACGKYWGFNMNGGGDQILSALDEQLFKQSVEEKANDINCISTYVAKLLIHNLQKSRIDKAKHILDICKCYQLANKLKIVAPDPTWLKKAAIRIGIKIMPREELERARRYGCDESIINSFFDLHSNLMNRNPLLIFNMDETMVSSKKKFKVLCGKQQHGLVMSDKVFPHMTACITIGACGHVMKPLFILPNKKKIDGLEEFEMDAYFASSISGWMNKRLFTYWAFCFLAEVSLYRLRLPPLLRNQRILLILDGHKSRANFFVAKLFNHFGIDILILPGHTSHLLQPFDVAVASSLKTEYKKCLMAYEYEGEINGTTERNMAETRKMMITCMIDALRKSGTIVNIKKGFAKAGIAPLRREIPLSSIYTISVPKKVYDDIRATGTVNNRCLNDSIDSLKDVYRLDYHLEPGDNIMEITDRGMMLIAKSLHINQIDGWALSKIPDLIIEKFGNIRRILIDY